MATTKTTSKTHDDAVAKAEGIRQATSAGASTQATATAGDIAHYRSCLASALANGIEPGVFVQALRALGTGGL